jgi:hypothetical protein
MDQVEDFIAESYEPEFNFGFHGKVHIRPVSNTLNFKTWMHVECSKKLSDLKVYPLKTTFLLKGFLEKPKKEGDRLSIYTNNRDKIRVVSLGPK